jgi:hypothetical protein
VKILIIYIKEIMEGKSRNPNFSRSLIIEQLRDDTSFYGNRKRGGIRFLYDLIGEVN